MTAEIIFYALIAFFMEVLAATDNCQRNYFSLCPEKSIIKINVLEDVNFIFMYFNEIIYHVS